MTLPQKGMIGQYTYWIKDYTVLVAITKAEAKAEAQNIKSLKPEIDYV